jgi:hypothetical protein
LAKWHYEFYHSGAKTWIKSGIGTWSNVAAPSGFNQNSEDIGIATQQGKINGTLRNVVVN